MIDQIQYRHKRFLAEHRVLNQPKMTNANESSRLKFEDIHTVLNGLKEYARIWQRGTKNDQVKMCVVILMWKSDIWYEVYKGLVELIIKPLLVTDSR